MKTYYDVSSCKQAELAKTEKSWIEINRGTKRIVTVIKVGQYTTHLHYDYTSFLPKVDEEKENEELWQKILWG